MQLMFISLFPILFNGLDFNIISFVYFFVIYFSYVSHMVV